MAKERVDFPGNTQKGLRSLYPSIAGKIFGWLEPDEAWTLWELARIVPRKGVIVEIGSFLGKSTVCLGSGSKNGNKAAVFTIDHHRGSPEHYWMLPPGQVINTFPGLLRNLAEAELVEIVKPLVATSKDAAKEFQQEIDLLFVDGSHEYEHVKEDFELWSPKLKRGGILVLHDVLWWPGPRQLLQEILSQGWRLLHLPSCPNMAVLRREKTKTW